MLRSIAFALLIGILATAASADTGIPYGSAIAENCGRFTIAPGGGEDLHAPPENEYRVTLQIWDVNGDPITTLAATDMWLDRPGELVPCYGSFNQADSGTDATGQATISGTIFGGLAGDAQQGVDCDELFLYFYAMGILLNDADPVCVSFDSPDLNGDLAVTVADFALYVRDFACWHSGEPCDPCHDYDEDGDNDVADFAKFASYFNQSTCP